MNERFAVLIVDDDPDIRETLREVLEAEGFQSVCAADGGEAMEALRRGLRPSLVVLDLMMPAMSGWELLAAARAERLLAEVPVAVVSASGGRTLPEGAQYFVRKPIDLDLLLELVRETHARLVRRRARAAEDPGPSLS